MALGRAGLKKKKSRKLLSGKQMVLFGITAFGRLSQCKHSIPDQASHITGLSEAWGSMGPVCAWVGRADSGTAVGGG